MARWIKNQRLASVGYLWAFFALTASPGAKDHYDRRRNEGDRHTAAQRNLFNRMIGCLHDCLTKRIRYDGATAFPASADRQLPTAAWQINRIGCLPLHDTTQNRIWLEIVSLALDLLAWMPLLALTGKARLWEPRRLRPRLFSTADQLVTTGRCHILRLAHHWPWTDVITSALAARCPPKPRLTSSVPPLRAASTPPSRGTRRPRRDSGAISLPTGRNPRPEQAEKRAGQQACRAQSWS